MARRFFQGAIERAWRRDHPSCIRDDRRRGADRWRLRAPSRPSVAIPSGRQSRGWGVDLIVDNDTFATWIAHPSAAPDGSMARFR